MTFKQYAALLLTASVCMGMFTACTEQQFRESENEAEREYRARLKRTVNSIRYVQKDDGACYALLHFYTRGGHSVRSISWVPEKYCD